MEGLVIGAVDSGASCVWVSVEGFFAGDAAGSAEVFICVHRASTSIFEAVVLTGLLFSTFLQSSMNVSRSFKPRQ